MPPTGLDEFRGLFSESPDPRQWPHVATGVMYRRAIEVLAEHLGCPPTEEAVYELRVATDPAQYASSLLRATRTELLLVDEGFPSAEVGTTVAELGELAGCPARPVMRIEQVAEGAGLPMGSLHTLRHTHITIALTEGIPVHVVAARAGDRPEQILSTYAHLLPHSDAEAAAAVAAAIAPSVSLTGR